jgi:hypothetical protein
MKTRTLLLALSLLANAGLLAAYLASPVRPPAARASSGTAPAADKTGSAAAATALQPGQPSAGTASQPGFSWAAIETDDIDEFARRLKAAGFSPNEIRSILFIRIEQGRPGASAAKVPYWRSPYVSPDPKSLEEQRKRIADYAKVSQKYLSPDNYDDPAQLGYARRRWGNLPVEKLKAIAAIEADYQNLNMEEYAKQRPRPGEETNRLDTYLLMQKEKLADIEKVLSPEEFAAYELRASPVATMLRTQLESFRPTEAEYLALFAIQKGYGDRLFNSRLTPEANQALRDEMSGKVRAALGEDRALDYEAAIFGSDQTARIVSRLGLPARVATEVRQAQQDFTKRAADIRANASLTPADRSAQLNALARQAETQLTTRLGATGFEAYSDAKGEWLRAIRPRDGPGGP